jgi:hypothetical protein
MAESGSRDRSSCAAHGGCAGCLVTAVAAQKRSSARIPPASGLRSWGRTNSPGKCEFLTNGSNAKRSAWWRRSPPHTRVRCGGRSAYVRAPPLLAQRTRLRRADAGASRACGSTQRADRRKRWGTRAGRPITTIDVAARNSPLSFRPGGRLNKQSNEARPTTNRTQAPWHRSPRETTVRALDRRRNDGIDALLLCNSQTHRAWVAVEDERSGVALSFGVEAVDAP